MEEISELAAPTRLKWIIVQAAPADDSLIHLSDGGPRRISIAPAPPLMNRNSTAARRERLVDMSVPHGFAVAEKLEQSGDIGQPWEAKQQTRSFYLQFKIREHNHADGEADGRIGNLTEETMVSPGSAQPFSETGKHYTFTFRPVGTHPPLAWLQANPCPLNPPAPARHNG